MTPQLKTPWYRRWWAVLGALLLLIVGFMFGWKQYHNYQEEQALAAEIALLNQSDPNWRLEDWAKRHPAMPDEQNLNLVALNIKSKAAREPGNYFTLFDSVEMRPPVLMNQSQVDALKTMLKDCKDLPAEMELLLKLPSGSSPLPNMQDKSYRVLGAMNLKIQGLREVCNTLKYQSDLWLQANQPAPAIRATEAMLHLAHAVGNDPGLINQLVSMALQGLAVGNVERTLALTEPLPALLEKLQARLLLEAKVDFFRRGVVGERAILDRHLREVAEGRYSNKELAQMFSMPSKTSGGSFSFDQLWAKVRELVQSSPYGSIPMERTILLRFFRSLLERVDATPPPTIQEMKEFVLSKRGSFMIDTFTPALHKVYEAELKRRAMLQLAAALVASERYRQATGKVPTGWNDIVPSYFPAVPTDPYDGKPLRWKNTSTGFILYTVWMNGVDDGGNIRYSSTTSTPPTDSGLEFYAPAHRRQPALPVKPEGLQIPSEDEKKE